MKMQRPNLAIAAVSIILLASCAKNDVSVAPDSTDKARIAKNYLSGDVSQESLTGSLDTIQLDFVFFLDMQYVECPPEQPIIGNTSEIGSGKDMQVEVKCLADVIGTGDGQGYAELLGRATARVDFNYSIEANLLCGKVRMDFVQNEDYLVIDFCGTPEENQPLTLTITRANMFDGNGRFEAADFEGTITLGSANEIPDETSSKVISNTTITGTLTNVTL